jgi:cytochrome c oxidase subunit 1
MHMLRPRSMTWFRMPAVPLGACTRPSIIQILLATPVLAITGFCSWPSASSRMGILRPRTARGDPILFQHFFWFTIPPRVYIMIRRRWVYSEVI